MGRLLALLAVLTLSAFVSFVRSQDDGCVPCPPGYASVNCTVDDCSPGYCNETDHCAICPVSTFAFNASQNCLPCEAGMVSQPGAANCTQCLAGTYAAVTEGICRGCPQGTWSSTGASSCQPCGQGRFSGKENATNSDSCFPCPAGYYCPAEINPSPILCPHDKYCPAQSVRPRSCGVFYTSEAGSVNCTLSNLVWLLVGLGGLLVLLVVGIILLRVGKRYRVESQRLQLEQETAKLIPKPLPGPVYSGD